uniref:Uncharacterized protein n=1 Tax=Setaria viridis TaxID=4556 RepID=A0A4U6U800_SETVI|nr:uncharacterized protein LOC117862971 isoform X3 [Setaria viridis]TKW06357.1 hypothetical protein SEVIR_7G237100v2 [Setaria viridis]
MQIQNSPCSWQPPGPRQRRRSYANTTDGTNGSPCSNQPHQATEISQGVGSAIPHVDLPEDVLQHIHSLMPMRDAARAACVSRRFLGFWSCYPNLVFSQESLAARKQPLLWSNEHRGQYVISTTKQVLGNHSGIGVKTLELKLSSCNKDDISSSLLDAWLQAFVKPGISELVVLLPECDAPDHQYNFPYSLLYDETGSSLNSIQSLCLASCGFHPIKGPRMLGCSRSLTKVCLQKVGVTGNELGIFLSICIALERLNLSNCSMITSLKIPCVLQNLRVLRLRLCSALQTVESDAPNLSTIRYEGCRPLLKFSLGDSLETKGLKMHATCMEDMIQYTGSNLPSIAPNLETLVLSTVDELKAPVMNDKFKHLKHLVISLGKWGRFCAGYDFFSLACFLDACIALETFILRIEDGFIWYKRYLVVGKPDENSLQSMEEIPELRHGGLGNLRKATITGFCSAKSLVKLTCHILESASSLQCLLLDTSPGYDRKGSSTDRCWPMCLEALRDAERALSNVREYVEPKVPAGVELKVLGPCSRCHAMDAKAMEEAESRIPRGCFQYQEDGSLALVLIQPRS